MRAVTFQAPGEVRVDDVPEPAISHPADAVVRIEASGICGSDLHIYHGRVKIEPGFVIGHEYVGTVVATGDDVRTVAAGDRVLGCFQTACGRCLFCRRGDFHKCDESRTFGHGAPLGPLPARLAMAETLGARPVHLTDDDPRAAAREATEGRGVDVCIDAVGDPRALELALRMARKCGTVQAIGVYAERCEVHMGLLWIKALTLRSGHANVLAHVDRVLAMMAAGLLDPRPLVTHRMDLDEAPEAYALYDRREALKIVLRP